MSPSHRRQVLPLTLSILFVLSIAQSAVALSFPAVVQEPPAAGRGQEPLQSPEAQALLAVDRLVEAFNVEDRDALVASFTPDAIVSQFNLLVDDFRWGDSAAPVYYT